MAVHIVLVERVIHTLPEYILGYMPSKSAKTLLTVKVDKNLKADAQVTADRLGLPLGTIINAFLLQLVRDQSFTIHYNEKLRKAVTETPQSAD
jgi:antitoxin component of RelBE/YafQ-DinJ toxin-antitoxin module